MGNISSSNPIYENVPMNEPAVLYSKDLEYWDSRMSAFNDDVRRIIWLAYTILRAISTIIIGFVFIAIVLNKKTRSKPYNLFLVFLMIPDLLYNVPGGVVYLMNYLKGSHISVAACKMESFFTVFGLCGNCWINALIALELYRMLKESYIRKHYYPPSVRVVTIRCLLAYLYCIVVGGIGAIGFEWLPYRTMLMIGGTACIPAPYDRFGTIIYYCVLSSLLIYLPFGVVTHITIEILRKGYLPKKGAPKRVLTLFFFRLLLVYVIFWMPGSLLAVLSTNPWWAVAGGFLAQFQGAVSAIAMLGKDDIMDCVRNFKSSLSFNGLVRNVSLRRGNSALFSFRKGGSSLFSFRKKDSAAFSVGKHNTSCTQESGHLAESTTRSEHIQSQRNIENPDPVFLDDSGKDEALDLEDASSRSIPTQ